MPDLAAAEHKKGSQLELAPENPTPDTTKEVKIMTTIAVEAPAKAPELETWRNLAGLIVAIRPEWAVDAVADTLHRCRNLKTFAELVDIGTRVASSYRQFETPSSIGMVAAGLVEL